MFRDSVEFHHLSGETEISKAWKTYNLRELTTPYSHLISFAHKLTHYVSDLWLCSHTHCATPRPWLDAEQKCEGGYE